VDGGYQIGGRWNYVSGSNHANWLILNCNIVDDNGRVSDAEGNPVTRMMIVPRSTAVIEKTWATLGMRGTGSNDVVIQEQFVPEAHTCLLYEPAATEGPYYNPRLVTAISWSLLSGMALGIARGAMNGFVQMATGSGSTTSPTLMRDRTPAQTTVGEAEAIISGSRAYVLDAVGVMWESACRGDADPGP
jgi:alkylation response protein AidB-like acyl-CoA dehydrogenase